VYVLVGERSQEKDSFYRGKHFRSQEDQCVLLRKGRGRRRGGRIHLAVAAAVRRSSQPRLLYQKKGKEVYCRRKGGRRPGFKMWEEDA